MHGSVFLRQLLLLLIVSVTVTKAQFSCKLVSDGGMLSRSVTLNEADSPCEIKNHLIVPPRYVLTLNPGVQLKFFPGKMLVVNGTLIAKGSPDKRVTLTKSAGVNDIPIFPKDIRLVDDYSVDRGRLQVNYSGKWRGICASFVNWTQADVDVACQQLGFETGNFSFLSWATNDSLYMLYTRPSCIGKEQSILDCPASGGIRIGSRVCRNQQTVHLRCYGLSPSSPYKDNWSGLELYNASSYMYLDDITMINESASLLSFVDILHAGVDERGRPLPALRASPLVPSMDNVTIRFCALDATNFTNVKSSAKLKNSWINANRGHGLVVETNLGHVEVMKSVLDGNQGNGIKAKFLDGRYALFDDLLSFCRMANLDRQKFPQTIIGIPSLGTSCARKFVTQVGNRLTLNVLEMDIEPDATGQLEVYDGQDAYGSTPLLASYNIVNGSLPMGVTSTYHFMYVRFSWRYKQPYSCPTLRDCVKFTIQIDSAPDSQAEFYMNDTLVESNLQHGVFLENARNYIHINASTVAYNGYGAGIRVIGGAGDILVNSSQVNYNQDNGVNITYDGGWKIFNGSSFSYNLGNGINITTNETSVDNKTRYTRHQRTEVSRSVFIGNDGHGVRVGNYCRTAQVAINDSRFEQNNRDAVDLESCFRIVPDKNVTNFTVAYNRFEGNAENAIRISPLLNAVGTISNNTFLNHSRYTLLIDNTDDIVLNEELYKKLLVDYSVISNRFEGNAGQYVIMARLTEGGQRQKMLVSYNVLTGNTIRGATRTSLNERARQYAVIVLSSSNVNVSRNHLQNPLSQFEIATHLMDMSVIIPAARQWWGTTNYSAIVERIFDQLSRYNLARVSYHPALEFSWLYTPVVTDRNHEMEIPFLRPGNILGGRLSTELRLSYGATYTVDRDINILNFGRLIVPPSTVIEFSNCLGMLVEGYVDFNGVDESTAIRLQLKNESTWYNNSLIRLVPNAGWSQDMNDEEEILEGRLEIRPTVDDEWGTVCNEGWTMTDASVVCQMMGLVIHPSSWRVLEETAGAASQPIYLSQVQCTSLDRDIWLCMAEDRWSHSCRHAQDVSVRCVRPSWAGVRFIASARASTMSHVHITGAGLMDPGAILYTPALTVDYDVHRLEYLSVTDNAADGVLITHNDVYANSKLIHSQFSRNQGNGVVVRASFFELYNCTLTENKGTGFVYNPSLSSRDGLQLRAGIQDSLVFDRSMTLRLGDHEVRWVTTPEMIVAGTVTYDLEIEVSQRFKIVMDLIDYTPSSDGIYESVTVFDTRVSSIAAATTRWQIERDVLDFPIVSQISVLSVRWTIRGLAAGRLAFVLRSRPSEWGYPFPVIHILNSTISANSHGIETNHYSQPSDFFLGLFHRYRWETIHMYGTVVHGNAYSAMRVLSKTKYDLLYLPNYEELERSREEGEGVRVAEISFEIDSCQIFANGGGISAIHNELEYSNNVWIWQVNGNRFEGNLGGGLTVDLPRVNLMYTELFNHSVDINSTVFYNNHDFEFRIGGFYCNASISNNRFDSNQCKVGCVTISGTEKDFEFSDNELVENQGEYIMEMSMNSHTPYMRWVDASVRYNNFKRNMRPIDSSVSTNDSSPTSRPTTYTLGVRGLQNVTINRNLFSNYLDFEVLGGQSSSMLENYLDVTYNWWGSTDQVQIKQRIFDFDDWNSFAIVEYYPFLTADSYSATQFTGIKYRPILDLDKPLGGRITENIRLKRRSTPYIIQSDLTIMSGYSLFIEEGVELQFYPSVGILVLGSMVCEGTTDSRIKFSPIPRANYRTSHATSLTERTIRSRKRRQIDSSVRNASVYTTIFPPSPVISSLTIHSALNKPDNTRILHPDIDSILGYQVRLTGGGNTAEGFIEIYNRTEMRWSLVCDRSFNEFTAEVACRTMGFEPSSVVVRRNRYYDIFVLGYPKMHEQVIEWFWRETLVCEGSEQALDRCQYRLNYDLYECMEQRQYVYVRCGERNLPVDFEYWGNIRYSVHSYENSEIQSSVLQHMQHVDIYGAGNLHDNKVAAVQAVYVMPNSSFVRVHHSASNGYDFVAPVDEFSVLSNNIENNNGYAVGAWILNGESSEQRESQFEPLYDNSVPYDIHGFIRMCTAEKLMYVKDRALIYHKYSFETIDCIKIIRSKEPMKQIGIRFLQVKLYNDSHYRNAIEMYDGEYFDSRMLIGRISSNSTQLERRLLYQTSKQFDTMGLRITASLADGSYGFIAEVVTLPLSPLWRRDPGKQQRVAHSSMTDNQLGGFVFKNVGENNPRVTVESNHIRRCGVRILNNTEPGVIDIYIQNTRMLTVANNYIADNAAGIFINTTTKDKDVAIYSNVSNNVITRCSHGEALHLEGHQYQHFDVRYNYIAYNDVSYRNVFSAFGVQLDFSNNIIYKNTAQCILNATVLEKISINQRYLRNAIYDNFAFAYNRSTIFLKSAKFEFKDNFLLNPYNVYEMVTFNRTKYPDGTYPSVDARNNWWGRNHSSYVAGRVWDRRDDDNLIRVEYEPFIGSNQSVLSGKCYPGWREYDSKCYWYFGGVVVYSEAESICRATLGRLAWARDPKGRERNLVEIVAQFQFNYDSRWRVWVYSDSEMGDSRCPALRDYRVQSEQCDALLPFICERDPYIVPHMNWVPIIIILSVVGTIIVFVLLPLLIFACIKSTQRQEEKLERREIVQRSLHASKCSLNSLGGLGPGGGALSRSVQSLRSIGTADEFKRRRPPINPDAYLDDETFDDTTDSLIGFKMPLAADFDMSHRPTSDVSSMENFFHKPGGGGASRWGEGESAWGAESASCYADSEFDPPKRRGFDQQEPYSYEIMSVPRVENEIPQVGHPLLQGSTFDDEYDDDDDIKGADGASTVQSFTGDLSDKLRPSYPPTLSEIPHESDSLSAYKPTPSSSKPSSASSRRSKRPKKSNNSKPAILPSQRGSFDVTQPSGEESAPLKRPNKPLKPPRPRPSHDIV